MKNQDLENQEAETEEINIPLTTEDWMKLSTPKIIRKLEEIGLPDVYDARLKKAEVIEKAIAAYKKLQKKVQKDENLKEILDKPTVAEQKKIEEEKAELERAGKESTLSANEREIIEKNISRIENQIANCIATHRDILVKKLANLKEKLKS